MKPEWKDAPEWAQWLAMDEDGRWYWCERKPLDTVGVFLPPDGGEVVAAHFPGWRETLERRPPEGPVLIPGGINSDDLIRAALSGQVDMMREHQSFMGKPVADKETAKVSISTAVVTCGGHCGESGD